MNLEVKYWFWDKGIDKHFCDEVIKTGLEQGTEQGKIGDENELNKRIRNSKTAFMSPPWIYNQIEPFFEDANLQAGWNYDIEKFESCQFTMYEGGENHHYDWHLDMGRSPYQSGFCKGLIRKLSMVILLNDPSEFEGGNLQFDYREPRDPGTTEYKFQQAGSIVVFPGFIWHRVLPVTKGTRYSLVIWATGKMFK